MEHKTLRLLGRSGEAAPWRLKNGEQTWEGIPPGIATANSPEMLKAGTRWPWHRPTLRAIRSMPIDDGSLIRVLPQWHSPEFNAWAVFPGRRLMPARTRGVYRRTHQGVGI